MNPRLRNKFNIIRYANCWEDADVLVKGLQVNAGSRVISIASGGGNSFSLLCNAPALVVAVDINPLQLYLVELKKCAIEKMEYEEFLSFTGVTASSSRIKTFKLLKRDLSSDCYAFFEKNLQLIEDGVIHSGKFETYFRLFRSRIMPLVHSKKKIDLLFENKSAEAQEIFFYKHWNNWRWKALFRVFFSRYMMGKYGRDPEFFKEVQASVAETIYQRASGYLVKKQVQHNPYLYYMFYGNFGNALPHYLRKENFEQIKKNISSLEIFKGFVQEAAKHYGNITHFNLSNIFEYMDREEAMHCAGLLHQHAAKNARLIYWNLLVKWQLHEALPGLFGFEEMQTNQLKENDQCFFYESCYINTVK